MIFVICPFGVRERDGVRGSMRLGVLEKFAREL